MTQSQHVLNRVPGKPEPVDIHVGARLRLRRTLVGLSQEKLGKACGLTFQQIQKYERGANRIGASRLYALSRILNVEPGFFFEDMPALVQQGQPPAAANAGDDVLARRETLELVRAYYRIPDKTVRRKLFEVVKAAGREPEAAPLAARCDAVGREADQHVGTPCTLPRGHDGEHRFRRIPAAAE